MTAWQKQFESKTRVPRTIVGAPAMDAYSYDGDVSEYFEELLKGCFGGYQIRKNADAKTLMPIPAYTPMGEWYCSCGRVNYNKFCGNCGKPHSQPKQWRCRCRTMNTTNFCPYCGTKKPETSSRPVIVTGNGTIHYLLAFNGVPKVAILLVNKNQWDSKEVQQVMDSCRQHKLPCLRFMREFRNTADYVYSRICEVIR